MTETSTRNKAFLATLQAWLSDTSEILVLIEYSHAAGDKSFEFFSSFDTLSARLTELRAETRVTTFRQPQLPIRGVVDDTFIEKCLQSIPDGSEFVVVETVQQTAGKYSWFHYSAGEKHAELRESLEDSRGTPVAFGAYPTLEGPDVVSAIVPDERGRVKRGVY